MEAVILIGIQGAGKSTFYRERFFDTHLRISLGMLRTRRREAGLVRACLELGQRFVVDNTNPTASDRARYVPAARSAGFSAVAYYFVPDLAACLRRNAQRSGRRRVPEVALRGTLARLEAPVRREGFTALYAVEIAGDGRFVVTAG